MTTITIHPFDQCPPTKATSAPDLGIFFYEDIYIVSEGGHLLSGSCHNYSGSECVFFNGNKQIKPKDSERYKGWVLESDVKRAMGLL